MNIPEITPLQSLVLGVLSKNAASGKEIRQELQSRGAKKSLPSFYQLMSRLEEAGFVTGSYKLISVNGKNVRERTYKITGQGRKVLQHSLDFSVQLEALVREGLQGA
ncbi:PadR family transcriptional regulator [Rhodopirellula baltica]|uniref:Transcription regulator PadR N-terminal domain-containing protein n=1 Tax=Rhodopirellula baltica WH47 TaxID=991778 RepID=F2ASH9_RHOBT|nr:PadR family transcriptional regulator [Rhodopirellula baltica]EGF27380.1 hypothetical protein RBWH47_03309 [Rhodopirellula baltica WH47]